MRYSSGLSGRCAPAGRRDPRSVGIRARSVERLLAFRLPSPEADLPEFHLQPGALDTLQGGPSVLFGKAVKEDLAVVYGPKHIVAEMIIRRKSATRIGFLI